MLLKKRPIGGILKKLFFDSPLSQYLFSVRSYLEFAFGEWEQSFRKILTMSINIYIIIIESCSQSFACVDERWLSNEDETRRLFDLYTECIRNFCRKVEEGCDFRKFYRPDKACEFERIRRRYLR